METKRCVYCRKLQRAESRVCSRCGRSLERRRSRGGKSWPSSVSAFSLPAASPHHAGYYSGLHPEDQPYQSNVIVTPQFAAQQALEKQSFSKEPKHIELPAIQRAPVAVGYRDISQASRRRQIPPRRSRRYPVTDQSSPGSWETRSWQQQDGDSQQPSRPFMREVITAAEREEASSGSAQGTVPIEVIPEPYEPERELLEIQQLPSVQNVEVVPSDVVMEPDRGLSYPPRDRRDSALGLSYPPKDRRDSALGLSYPPQEISRSDASVPSIVNGDTLLLKDLPPYMQKALRPRRWSPRLTSIVVLVGSFCLLVAISVMVLVWMGNLPVNGHSPANTTASARTSGGAAGAPHLEFSPTQVSFDPAASGVVSSQTMTLVNSGSGQVVWQEQSDSSWLTVSPQSGRFTDRENIQITVNRQGLAPGDYAGHVTFLLQGQENTPFVLDVTMSVASVPTQLSVSATSLSYSIGQSEAPDSQVLVIGNTGVQSLNWDAAVSTDDGASWLRLSLLHGELPSGGNQSITVEVASQNLPIGTYTGLISFTGSATAQVKVSLTVLSNTIITPSSLPFTMQQTNQTVSLQNRGNLSLKWTVIPATTDGGNWLSVTSANNGTLASGQSVTLTVRADPTHLAPGSYQGTLIFSFGDQTKQVLVFFVVMGTSPTPAPTPIITPVATPPSANP
jgi:hypothetical protein